MDDDDVDEEQWPKEVPLPRGYYLGAYGDPIAWFDRLILLLHEDGSVTWKVVER